MSIKDEIKSTLISFMDAIEAEKEADFGEMATRLIENEKWKYWWETPEKFWTGFIYPAAQALEAVLKKKYPNCTKAALIHFC